MSNEKRSYKGGHGKPGHAGNGKPGNGKFSQGSGQGKGGAKRKRRRRSGASNGSGSGVSEQNRQQSQNSQHSLRTSAHRIKARRAARRNGMTTPATNRAPATASTA